MRVLMLFVVMNLALAAEFVWLVLVVPVAAVERRLRSLTDWAETECLLATAQAKTRRGG